MTRFRWALLAACILLASACGNGGTAGEGDDLAAEAVGGDAAATEDAATEEPAAGPSADATASEDPAGADASAAPTDLGRAALIVAQGGLGDESYNDLALQGFQRGLEATRLEGTPIESDDIVAQGEQVLRRAAESDFGLLVDLEFSHGEIFPAVAADYPDVNFAILNLEAAGDNVASILFQEQEGSYLAGALAAMQTTNTADPQINPEKVIGVIGGTKSVGIDKFLVGYVQGARDVDPEVEVLVSYTDDFADPALGQQQAQAMFEQGADIVYHVAGGTGAGVIEAAEQADRYAIGVDTDQDALAPGHVLTSMIKRTDVAVEEMLTRYAGGDFPGGETITLGLAEDGVGLSPFTHTEEAIPQEFRDRVEELKEQIIAGEIEVWNVVEQGYPDFFEG